MTTARPSDRRATSRRRSRLASPVRSRVVRMFATLLLLPLTTLAALAGLASPAAAAGTVSATVDAGNGFPVWYQDGAGTRLEPCLDPGDANCVLPPDITGTVSFPDNFPDEFFYTVAQSDNLATSGCGGLPGKANVRTALEGAFVNGAVVPGEQMVFGRIRVTATGLCPDTSYKFKHPFGTATLKTNDLGIIARTVGTEDIGCLPTPPAKCAFEQATGSRVFGGAEGFLRWDPNVGEPTPAGYLGDAVTLHQVVGATSGFNGFAITDLNDAVITGDQGAAMTTNLFTVSGKIAGPLSTNPKSIDFAGVEVADPPATRTVTVTNLASGPVTPGLPAVAGAEGFGLDSTTCNGPLNRDQTCDVVVRFDPADPTLGVRHATLTIPHDGTGPALTVPLSAAVIDADAQPAATADPASVSFADTRVRTVSDETLITLTSTGTGGAPFVVNGVSLDNVAEFFITQDTCSTGTATFAPDATCQIGVKFAPTVAATHTGTITVTNNGLGDITVPLTGVGFGGDAAVSASKNAINGFPDWYMDESGIKVQQCTDKDDPYCIMLPDATFDPARPTTFLDPNDPTQVDPVNGLNFPEEFFYHVVDSDQITTPGCLGSAPGKAFIRTAVEGAFANGEPAPQDQMVFGRIRIAAIGGLCPNTKYDFVHPYGVEHLTTNGNGSITRVAGTEDVGCAPVAPDTCDFELALSSRVLGGLLRWDPAVAPAAPAGYLGDAATLHKIVGAPFTVDDQPANFFRIVQAADPENPIVPTDVDVPIGETDLFTVMGKLQGPLELTDVSPLAVGAVFDPDTIDFNLQSVSVESGVETATLTNTGIKPLDVTGASIIGADVTDFAIKGGTCTGGSVTLAQGDTCTIRLSFTPGASGNRSATLEVRSTGFNDPMHIALVGIGQVGAGTPTINFSPSPLKVAPIQVGRTTAPMTVVISNAGGQAPLAVGNPHFLGVDGPDFSILDDQCLANVAEGSSCTITVVGTPQTAGPLDVSLEVEDNVNGPGSQHSVAITGTVTNVHAAVSPNNDRYGFPQYYQDENGVRTEPCLQASDPGCIVLGDEFFNPANPVTLPGNFPSEFFYTVADSEIVPTPGCPAFNIPAGDAMLRVATEGTFATPDVPPAVDDQIVFTRLRVTASGLCPNLGYRFVTPYGVAVFQTNGTGDVVANAGTQDVGCGAAPCTFSDALADGPGAPGTVDTSVDGFLRWDPNVTPNAPTDHLGDAVAFHKVVGGTYRPQGDLTPLNAFEVREPGGNLVSRTDKFMVSGRQAGPLVSDPVSVNFGDEIVGVPGDAETVTITNVGPKGTSVASVAVTGLNQGDFALDPAGTCMALPANMDQDATCTVVLRMNAAGTGLKNAVLRVTSTNGQAATVDLTGRASPPPAPAIGVAPGVLAFGTRTPTTPLTLYTVVSNTGDANLVVTGKALTGAAAGDYEIDTNVVPPAPNPANCGLNITVPPNGRCAIAVKFTPKAQGARTGALVLTHNDNRAGVAGTTTISLTATGSGSSFTASPTTVGFSNVTITTTKSQTLTIKNNGTTNVTLAPYVANGSTAVNTTITGTQRAFFNVVGGTCLGTAIQPGKSCNITVTFRPTQRIAYTAVLSLKGDANSLPATFSVPLTGAGK